jgi:rhodanese-related sulfurtransferase
MSQNTRTQGLVVITIAALIAFVIGFLTLGDDTADYEISVESALEALEQADNMVGLDQAQKMINSEDAYVLVDLRNQVEYNQGHLEGAVSVPFAELLTEESLAFFLDQSAKHFILYGNAASQASNAWMMLRQVGLEQVKFIPGTYDVVANTIAEVPLDMAAHNYKAIFEKVQKEELESIAVGKVTNPRPQPKAKVIIPEKKPAKRRLEGC